MQSAKEITNVDHIVGERLREARIAQGFTMVDLAKLTGRSAQQIQKYEKGQNRIAAGLLFDLSIVLNRPVIWFYGDTKALYQTKNKNDFSEFHACLDLLYQLEHTEHIPIIKGFLEMMAARTN